MMYLVGTIADVTDNGTLATLILDAGHRQHQLQADSRQLDRLSRCDIAWQSFSPCGRAASGARQTGNGWQMA